jgi:hypothetical protein
VPKLPIWAWALLGVVVGGGVWWGHSHGVGIPSAASLFGGGDSGGSGAGEATPDPGMAAVAALPAGQTQGVSDVPTVGQQTGSTGGSIAVSSAGIGTVSHTSGGSSGGGGNTSYKTAVSGAGGHSGPGRYTPPIHLTPGVAAALAKAFPMVTPIPTHNTQAVHYGGSRSY